MESLDEIGDAVGKATLGIEEVASMIDQTAQNASDIGDETGEVAVEEQTTVIQDINDAINDVVD